MAVTLSAAKGLARQVQRSFAALRMTAGRRMICFLALANALDALQGDEAEEAEGVGHGLDGGAHQLGTEGFDGLV